MSKLHELGTGWAIAGHVATRGAVTITHIDSPSCYRARVIMPILGTLAVTEYEPITARDALRKRIVHEFAKYDELADALADALIDIDAPDAPEVTP